MTDALERLDEVLVAAGPLVVAFSGGADSAFLARRAHDVLGRDAVVVVTAVSASLAPDELEHCRSLATEWNLDWRTVATDELDNPDYVRNDGDRCAHCKDALMDAVVPMATELGATVALGVNVDDLGDHRPGQQAEQCQRARAGDGTRNQLAQAPADHLAQVVADQADADEEQAQPCEQAEKDAHEPV